MDSFFKDIFSAISNQFVQGVQNSHSIWSSELENNFISILELLHSLRFKLDKRDEREREAPLIKAREMKEREAREKAGVIIEQKDEKERENDKEKEREKMREKMEINQLRSQVIEKLNELMPFLEQEQFENTAQNRDTFLLTRKLMLELWSLLTTCYKGTFLYSEIVVHRAPPMNRESVRLSLSSPVLSAPTSLDKLNAPRLSQNPQTSPTTVSTSTESLTSNVAGSSTVASSEGPSSTTNSAVSETTTQSTPSSTSPSSATTAPSTTSTSTSTSTPTLLTASAPEPEPAPTSAPATAASASAPAPAPAPAPASASSQATTSTSAPVTPITPATNSPPSLSALASISNPTISPFLARQQQQQQQLYSNQVNNYLPVLTAMYHLMVRKEFDMTHLSLDVHNAPQCPEIDLVIAEKYRVELCNLQQIIVDILSEYVTYGVLERSLITLCSKILAVNFFRMPLISTLILQALLVRETDEEQIKTQTGLPLPLPPLSGDNKNTNILSAYPSLFKWNLFHITVSSYTKKDILNEKSIIWNSDWLKSLTTHEGLFWNFSRDWVNHLRNAIDVEVRKTINWWAINGYKQLLHRMLVEFSRTAGLSQAMMDASCAFLSTNPILLNYFMKMCFLRTNAYEVNSVIELLNDYDNWLKELSMSGLQIGPDFDWKFYCLGLEKIFDTDRHQLVMRALSSLYKYAHVFVDEPRKQVFCEFLLKKYFYHFFLHWDQGVRNAYHQLLVFRMIRTKRSQLVSQSPDDSNHRFSGKIKDEDNLDVVMLSKIQSFVKVVEDQLRGDVHSFYPKHSEVYAAKALSDYRLYLSKYYEWEAKGDLSPPPLMMIKS